MQAVVPQVSAFVPAARPIVHKRAANVVLRCSNGVINPSVDKENPKVVNIVKTSEIDKKGVYCRCWRSGKFPICDGQHVKHNKETGDNVGPLIVDKAE